MPKLTHEFDSSRTCDYCGIPAERIPEIAECPERVRQSAMASHERAVGDSLQKIPEGLDKTRE